MKKILAAAAAALMLGLGFVSCSTGDDDEGKSSPSISYENNKTPVIYLAGDSTVKTYEENQWIGGWGQFLSLFLKSSVKVVNCAQGGRSSRSFINEGRLWNNPDSTYTFTQNEGKSIESVIGEGDFLLIQFGHNDDDTKKSSMYTNVFDRMVPLGEADAKGKYPVTAGQKVSTTYLPDEYKSNVSAATQTQALAETAKYGSNYYSYDCGGTFKWYLKQYVDFARSKGAVPVLVTPVARVKFSGNEIIGGPGLHGENFAYVQAVRQLAEEEDCLLIDLFAQTKLLLETATPSYADFLMAIVPNDLTGSWPEDYDSTYGNSDAGFSKMEATHYNKYGAYLTAAYVAEQFINNTKVQKCGERFNFSSNVLRIPSKYVDPSNLISRSAVENMEKLYKTVSVTNPSRTSASAAPVVELITAIEAMGEITKTNFSAIKAKCDEAALLYSKLNVDDRGKVTNYSILTAKIKALSDFELSLRPKPSKVVLINAENLEADQVISSVYEGEGFKVVGTSSKSVTVKANPVNYAYNGTKYELANSFSMGGSAAFGTARYIEFTLEKAASVTVTARSTGSSNRTLNVVSAANTSTVVTSFPAPSSTETTTKEIAAGGTYYIGSASSGIYVCQIVIEYFD